jgi:hypothetical protein
MVASLLLPLPPRACAAFCTAQASCGTAWLTLLSAPLQVQPVHLKTPPKTLLLLLLMVAH